MDKEIITVLYEESIRIAAYFAQKTDGTLPEWSDADMAKLTWEHRMKLETLWSEITGKPIWII